MNRKPGLIASGIAIIWMLGLLGWASLHLPAGQVPTHWNAHGVPDGFGSHQEAVALLAVIPLLELLVTALLAVTPMIEPRRLNLLRSARAYTAIWIGQAVVMALIYTIVAFSMVDVANPLQFVPALMIATGGLIALVGNYLSKIRSTFLFGIRTPWTLSSDRSWNRTHRVGGRLFVALGVLIASSALLPAIAPWVVLIGVLGVIVFLVVYSYREWARDPEKLQIGR